MKIKGEFESENEEVYRCMIEYTGPIKHNLNQSVRLDFSGRKTPYNVQEKQIIDDYGSETAHVMVRTMDLAEMFAEKCRALITRKEQKSKDLFDIYFLINKDVVVDRRLINIKFTGYNESFNENYFDRAVRDTASVWKRDLQDLIPRGDVPDIDNVISLVRKKLF
ncbi:MAG: nucleotidyl transferase AbiEii/AbiGii toxin family protein, partial [Thermoplasmatales archaeon]|nr:nucleotidyl transferase AbiEii/AbiGii toxin family protein [Thermoplasmatales archaeon]